MGGQSEAGTWVSAWHLAALLPTRARIGISERIVTAADWLPSQRSGVVAGRAV